MLDSGSKWGTKQSGEQGLDESEAECARPGESMAQITSSTTNLVDMLRRRQHSATSPTLLFTLGRSAELCTLTISTLSLLSHALEHHKDGRPAAACLFRETQTSALIRVVHARLLDEPSARSCSTKSLRAAP